MQTLHSLRSFRDLRTILLELRPSRWPTPLAAPKWETAQPLPNPLEPTCAVGWRTAPTRRQFNPDTPWGADLLTALWKRKPQNGGSCDPVLRRVCRAALVGQTTGCRARLAIPHKAGKLAGDLPVWQRDKPPKRFWVAASLCSPVLSFVQPTLHYGARCAEQKAGGCASHRLAATSDLCGVFSGLRRV